MDLLSIASGSSGNCYYVGSEETHLLVDAGVSGKKIESALNEIDRKPSDLNGILVTHEHIDHVKGLGVMARKHGIPIYTTGGTISFNFSSGTLNAIRTETVSTQLMKLWRPKRFQ